MDHKFGAGGTADERSSKSIPASISWPTRGAAVVHVESLEQAQRNARIAREAGADGAFLINHRMADQALLDIHAAVADAQTGWWIGVNCLGMSPEQVFGTVSGRSVGSGWITPGSRRPSQPLCRPCGSPPETPAFAVASTSAGLPSSTSGTSTTWKQRAGSPAGTWTWSRRAPGHGHAAAVEKIRRYEASSGWHAAGNREWHLAENVGDYLPHADCFLVATGISRSFTELEPARVLALVRRVAEFKGNKRVPNSRSGAESFGGGVR